MADGAMSLGEQWRILRLEGMQSVQNRTREAGEEAKRVKRLATLSERDGRLDIAVDNPLVVNVTTAPPPWERTVVHQQLFDRLDAEKKKRTVALVYPKDDCWRLEVWSATTAGIFTLKEGASAVDAIVQAARLTRARIIHIESLTGLPLHLVQSLAERDYEVVLSIHDFTPFCIRPQLIEQRSKRFCDYCTDLDRCAACLQDVPLTPYRSQADYRKAGTEAVRKARVLIYPSAFMQRRYADLYPRRQAGQHELVTAPAVSKPEVDPWAKDATRVAFVGGVELAAGAALIAPTVEQLRRRNTKMTAFVYGTGDEALTAQLRKVKGVKIQGYYRPGSLATLLARDKISVAVMPAIWPEPYGVVIDECLAAGVQTIAFDLGAVADRLNFWEVGRVVRPQHGPPGLATAVFDTIARNPKVPSDVVTTIPSPERTARRCTELYKSLRVRMK
jgi:glycosyltransferase involved in cell wall biosynthesis